MYAHLCKGLTWRIQAHMHNEIMLPYAGIIRIRFMGMISASVARGTPASIFQISPQGRNDIVISSAVERSFIRLI